MDAESLFCHMVHQGLLHESEFNSWTCPIPSLRRFVIDEGHAMAPDRIPASVSSSAPSGDEDGVRM